MLYIDCRMLSQKFDSWVTSGKAYKTLLFAFIFLKRGIKPLPANVGQKIAVLSNLTMKQPKKLTSLSMSTKVGWGGVICLQTCLQNGSFLRLPAVDIYFCRMYDFKWISYIVSYFCCCILVLGRTEKMRLNSTCLQLLQVAWDTSNLVFFSFYASFSLLWTACVSETRFGMSPNYFKEYYIW